MNNSKNYIGISNLASCGQTMTIIEYVNAHDITVKFEDNTVVKHKSLSNFYRGRIANPNCKLSHLGEWIDSKYGMKATIIAYRHYNDIDVKFDDGYIAYSTNYSSFQKDEVLNKYFVDTYGKVNSLVVKNERLGQTAKARNGQNITIIEYFDSNNITVKFDDGTIVYNKAYSNFLIGNIRNPNRAVRCKDGNGRWNDRTGESTIASNGQRMTIIRYGSGTDIDIQFEDGTIVYNKSYNNFRIGKIMNPNKKLRDTAEVGMTNKSKAGLDMSITEILPNGRIKVKFNDGTEVITTFYTFKSGYVKSGSNLEKQIKLQKQLQLHIGEKWKDSTGKIAEIIERVLKNGKPSSNYIVKWENGQTLETSYSSITNAKFSSRHANKVGLKSYNKNGEVLTIIAYRNSHDIDVEFEDGTVITNRCLSDFYSGLIDKNSLINKELRSMCSKAYVNYDRALKIRRINKLTNEQTIQYLNPYCYFNITGDFIIVPLPKSR